MHCPATGVVTGLLTGLLQHAVNGPAECPATAQAKDLGTGLLRCLPIAPARYPAPSLPNIPNTEPNNTQTGTQRPAPRPNRPSSLSFAARSPMTKVQIPESVPRLDS